MAAHSHPIWFKEPGTSEKQGYAPGKAPTRHPSMHAYWFNRGVAVQGESATIKTGDAQPGWEAAVTASQSKQKLLQSGE